MKLTIVEAPLLLSATLSLKRRAPSALYCGCPQPDIRAAKKGYYDAAKPRSAPTGKNSKPAAFDGGGLFVAVIAKT
ncbi:hypothetical protein NKH85_04215 [Mesorhizobium sp. M0924]|uniref:hypothetical protein n=1 Tax=unclassified Mesorhizobium TaxID=325217 RepID=UPI003339904F